MTSKKSQNFNPGVDNSIFAKKSKKSTGKSKKSSGTFYQRNPYTATAIFSGLTFITGLVLGRVSNNYSNNSTILNKPTVTNVATLDSTLSNINKTLKDNFATHSIKVDSSNPKQYNVFLMKQYNCSSKPEAIESLVLNRNSYSPVMDTAEFQKTKARLNAALNKSKHATHYWRNQYLSLKKNYQSLNKKYSSLRDLLKHQGASPNNNSYRTNSYKNDTCTTCGDTIRSVKYVPRNQIKGGRK